MKIEELELELLQNNNFIDEDDDELLLQNLVSVATSGLIISDEQPEVEHLEEEFDLSTHHFTLFITDFCEESLLIKNNADIICFQQITYTQFQELLTWEFIKKNYYISQNFSNNILLSTTFQIILSKMPIITNEFFPFHVSSCNGYIFIIDISFPVNIFQPNGDTITIVNVVLDTIDAMRQNQFEELQTMFKVKSLDNVFLCCGTKSLDTKFVSDVWSSVNDATLQEEHKAVYYTSKYYFLKNSQVDGFSHLLLEFTK